MKTKWNCTHFTGFIFFMNIIYGALSDPRLSESGLICNANNKPPPRGNYIRAFAQEMDVLKSLVTSHQWGTYVINSSADSGPSIYGLAECHRDLPHTDCLLCNAASCTGVSHCLPVPSGRIYLDGCFLRYDDYNFLNESTDPYFDKVNCSASSVVGAEVTSFEKSVGDLVDRLVSVAMSSGGYGLAETQGVFGLAQCWRSVSEDGCRECLEKASREVRKCAPSTEGRAMNAGCYLRYSTYKFYSDGPDQNLHESSGHGDTSTAATLAIALPATAFLVLLFFVGYVSYIRFSKLKQERTSLKQIFNSNSFYKSNLNFKYEILEKATNYFDPSRKLGQGGAGSVFRGTLPNGQTVAVKRLFFTTRQWVDEFFNEVNLISRIKHKNLVRLLGCSIEGPESLLVYEYVPNKSLDQFLFDKDKTYILNWKQRFDIIVGAAEGLAYLHGGSQLKIIHRDIKSSNVLLDENFAPKISDFGLARCLASDRTHLTTGIAGTLGYMAPEYLVRGQLTEKADVYSFGVLVLETLCGRKNNAILLEDSGSVLQNVWMFYKADKLADSVDSRLNNDFPREEAIKVLRIGLLCSQASAAARPSMAEVVELLTSQDSEIPEPTQPPFLSAKMSGSASANSSSMRSFISNALTKLENSPQSTESSSIRSSDGLSKEES